MQKLEDQTLAQLSRYIIECVRKGIAEAVIKEQLIKAGWSKDKIKSVFESINIQKIKSKDNSTDTQKTVFIAEQVMSRDLVTVNKEEYILNIVALLKERNSGYVFIVENNRPIGIITGSDIVRTINNKGILDKNLRAMYVMTSPLVKSDKKEKLIDVISRMKINNIERIPVVQGDKLVGVITSSDIIKFLSYS
ncbi:CBS domain-containing protein [Candidatus Woesearchaeota archaeon]|nr:CBS domain-containing protein [Candidatus Woesearchaeota archaeon]